MLAAEAQAWKTTRSTLVVVDDEDKQVGALNMHDLLRARW